MKNMPHLMWSSLRSNFIPNQLHIVKLHFSHMLQFKYHVICQDFRLPCSPCSEFPYQFIGSLVIILNRFYSNYLFIYLTPQTDPLSLLVKDYRYASCVSSFTVPNLQKEFSVYIQDKQGPSYLTVSITQRHNIIINGLYQRNLSHFEDRKTFWFQVSSIQLHISKSA